MVWFVFAHLAAYLVDLVVGGRRHERDKDLQIAVPRRQPRPMQRQRPRPLRLSRAEKRTLAVLTAVLARLITGPRRHLDRYVLLFKPDTGYCPRTRWVIRGR